ncbi:hypothetical protein K469DRAFT_705654 [Zopfia rhizophila CBS 207.26]|uniref:F-box domain-containing protein n=1 Tax=Zopfia rhizophila CBS 207.26 TaxID=1314779 RepID=A0A6A6E990_9PEZI|nr:hypothetical protein K469DRAFT_705654 [Zopfia rhizophila CBS 207.26]
MRERLLSERVLTIESLKALGKRCRNLEQLMMFASFNLYELSLDDPPLFPKLRHLGFAYATFSFSSSSPSEGLWSLIPVLDRHFPVADTLHVLITCRQLHLDRTYHSPWCEEELFTLFGLSEASGFKSDR